jgi:hypothetical protein
MLHILRFFSLQDAVYLIMLPFSVPVIFTFEIQGALKFKKKSGAKWLKNFNDVYIPCGVKSCTLTITNGSTV